MKLLFEIITLVLFFAVYQIYDLEAAILVVIVCYSLITAAAFIKHRRLSKMQFISFVLVVVLGSATLLFQNELFFKWKPTLVYWLFSCVLIGSQVFGKQNLLQRLGNGNIVLPDQVWSRLSLAWIIFLLFMGTLNLFIAYNFNTQTWVYFKIFGALGLLLTFMVAQCICLWRYIAPLKVEKIMTSRLPRAALITQMRTLLETACSPEDLTIIDDSAQHVGHTGHQGAGHFTVKVVSSVFQDLSLIKRHQLVYHALKAYMGNDIHALSIVAKTPAEI